VFVVHEVEPNQVGSDIRLFLRHNFSKLTGRPDLLTDLPAKEYLDTICERTAGLFIYPVATVKHVFHRNNGPRLQLDRILQSPKSSAYEGETRFKPNTTPDSEHLAAVARRIIRRFVLSLVLWYSRRILFPRPRVDPLLGTNPAGVFLKSPLAHSLLVPHDENYQVRTFHKSSQNLTVNQAPCTNERFRISPPSCRPELPVDCRELNMCKLPGAVVNSEVNDLEEKTERCFNFALRYARILWHGHLNEHAIRTPVIAADLHRFLEKELLLWLEVLGILGARMEAVEGLEVVAKWLEVRPTLDVLLDWFQALLPHQRLSPFRNRIFGDNHHALSQNLPPTPLAIPPNGNRAEAAPMSFHFLSREPPESIILEAEERFAIKNSLRLIHVFYFLLSFKSKSRTSASQPPCIPPIPNPRKKGKKLGNCKQLNMSPHRH